MKIKCFLILFLFSVFVSPVLAESVEEQAQLDFIKAGAFYQTEDYANAIEQYHKIIDRGYVSQAVYYNLANSYFKSEQLGQAILYYQKAVRLAPRDPDIEANLRFALSLVEKYGEQKTGSLWEKLMPHFHLFTQDEITWMVLFLFFLLGMSVLLGVVRQWRLSRHVLWSGTLFVLLAFHITVLVFKVNYLSGQSVVLKNTKAKFEPMDDATDYFQLGEGMVVKALNRNYGWVKVKREDNRIGWIPESVLGEI